VTPFDHAIGGAGRAGCVPANRLSADPGVGVLRRLLEPAGLADPYAIYAELREREVSGERLGRVVVGHAQATAALTSRELSAERIDSLVGRLDPQLRKEVELATRTLKAIVTFRDPPEHTRIRRLLSQALKARAVSRQASVIEQAANRLLDKLRDTTTADLHAALAYPLPAMVVAGILGIPVGDRHVFQRWANDVALLVGSGALDERIARRTLASVNQMRAYMRKLVAARRVEPAEDLLSAMVHAADGEGMSEEEIHANALFLMTARHETATNLLSNALLTLLRHPDQLELLRTRPDLISSCVEEVLRFESPVQITVRVTAADTALGGRTLTKGMAVLIVLGAANRDPEVFDWPEEFLIERGDRQHLAFGTGPHWCIGGPLAREEARVVLGLVLERLPGLRREEDEITWQPTLDFRGPQRLKVRWG
jgi:cytochrome P450